jgi:predicted dehydrogenase
MTGNEASRPGLRKAWRYLLIYGAGRTLYKSAGRLRLGRFVLARRHAAPDIGLVGCGQFAFATISYFLNRAYGRRVAACFDIDPTASRTLSRAHGVPRVCDSFEQLLDTPGLKTLYIASNHASHAPYAVAAIRRGLDVYVEKPIAVSYEQLDELLAALGASRSRIFAGYNRPFSRAIRELRQQVRIHPDQGITLGCFVSGHRLGPQHWYRRPEEGTRVCGNIGHWLDLMVHVFAWRGLPDRLDISITWAHEAEPDDDVCIAIGSDRGDVVSLVLTSRTEPFEGINESINFQHGETIAKIDDFRRMTIWQHEHLFRRRYWPKDVGHGDAILQPFRSEPQRGWDEVVLSTRLMLHIADMVRNRQRHSVFSLAAAARRGVPGSTADVRGVSSR